MVSSRNTRMPSPRFPPGPAPHSRLQGRVVAWARAHVLLPALVTPLSLVTRLQHLWRDGLRDVGGAGGGGWEGVAMTREAGGNRGGVGDVGAGGLPLHDRHSAGAGE